MSWGIVRSSAVALEHSGECNPKTIAAALRYVETAQERIIERLGKLDALRMQRSKPGGEELSALTEATEVLIQEMRLQRSYTARTS